MEGKPANSTQFSLMLAHLINTQIQFNLKKQTQLMAKGFVVLNLKNHQTSLTPYFKSTAKEIVVHKQQ